VIYVAGGNTYRLVRNHKNGWNPEAFRERYSEVLERYDYIVGDWGYNQLRLKGFFRDNHPKATKETSITGLVDYLSEYCNFGCAWFVLAKVDRKQLPADEQVVSVEPSVSAYIGGESQDDGGQGLPMRWRAGGATYVPHISAYDLARAQAEMEKRRATANTAAPSRENGRNGSAGSGEGGFRFQEERRPNGGANRSPNAQNAQHAEAKPEEKPVRTHAQSQQQGKGGGQGDSRSRRQQGNFRPEPPRDAAPSRAAEQEPASGKTNAAAPSVQQGRQEETAPVQGRPGEGRPGGGRGGHWGRRHRHKRRQGKSFRPPSETSRTDK
jgi:uncharacterized protein YutD